MPSIINALTASGGGVAISGDATGNLALQTAGNTAATINTSKGVQFDNCIGVGNATPSTSGAGITFPATQSASTDANTLDDYEEGSWTLTITGSTSGSPTFTSRVAQYAKVGRLVSAYAYYNIASKSTLSGTLNISLPFPIANVSGGYASIPICYWDDMATSVVNLIGYGNNNDSTFTIGKITTAAGNSNARVTDADINNGHELMFTVTYLTNS